MQMWWSSIFTRLVAPGSPLALIFLNEALMATCFDNFFSCAFLDFSCLLVHSGNLFQLSFFFSLLYISAILGGYKVDQKDYHVFLNLCL